MARTWRLLARHKWVAGAAISEYYNETTEERRFTATIRGYGNWCLYQGPATSATTPYVICRTRNIRDRIDDKDQTVFTEKHHPGKELYQEEQRQWWQEIIDAELTEYIEAENARSLTMVK